MNSKQLREFIHTLRNPLTGIIANVEFLMSGDKSISDKEKEKILQEIIFNAKYLDNVMQSASDLVKIKNKNEILYQIVNVETIIKNLISEFNILFETENQIKLVIKNKILIKANFDILNRFFKFILYELIKFVEKKEVLKIEIFAKKINCFINFVLKEKQDNYIEKILNEIFSKNNQKIIFKFIQKVLYWFSGEAKVFKENNFVFLQIVFKKSTE